MEFKQLQYFLEIINAGSITQAANNLHLPQPYLSQQLKKLEAQLDVTLIERTTRSIKLTNAGMALQKRAKQILTLESETVIEVLNSSKGENGELKIGGVTAVVNNILMPQIKQFHDTFPNVTFDIQEYWAKEIFNLLSYDLIELGVIRTPIESQLFNSIILTDEPLTMVGTDPEIFDNHRADLSVLKSKPILIDHRYSELFIQACRNLGFTPNIVTLADSSPTLLSLAKRQFGTAIVPTDLINTPAAASLNSKIIDNHELMTHTAVIWKKDSILSEPAKNFLYILQKEYK